MSSPVGGSLPPPPLPPVVVINVPSPTVFGLLRGMVDVIHATHVHVNYHQANQTGLSGRGSRPVIVVYSNPADQTDADVTIESTGPGTKPSEPSTDSPKLNLPGTSAHPPKEGEPERRRVELPPGFEVPDLTDHSPARSIEEKLKYQRMVREYIERIARIVKEMSISKEINKREIVEAAESARESRGVEQPVSKQKSEKGSAGAPNSPAEVDAAEEEDVHHIDLIIETVAEDGRIEQIPVERCEIADLVENLEDILGHEIAPDQTQPQAAEASPKEKPAKGGKEPSPTAMNKTGVGGKVLGKASPQSLTDPAGKAGGLQPLASSTPVIGAAAVASYMPYAGQTPGRQEKAAAGDGFKVEQIEGEEAASRFGSDNMERREAGKVPGEGAAAAKVSRKSARQTSVQGVADTAAKEQRAKKTQTQRLDDERIIPVHGKFSVDQLKGVRRRRGKGEAAGSVGGAETHRLIDILYMVMCAVICGSETIFDITAFIESREKWFTTVLGLRNGLPGTSLISKLLVSFNASQLSDMLQIWMREALGAPAKSGLASIVISETPEGILFAQEKAAAGSTAEQCLPRIVQFFEMRGVVMLLSNGKASKKIMDTLLDRGANYIYDCGEESFFGESELIPLFEKAIADPKGAEGVEFAESYVEGHEYLQLFEVAVEDGAGSVQSVSQVLSEVVGDNGKEETVQYFTSSLPKQSVWLFELLRTQRSLESKMEWTLNVSMRGKHGDEAAFAAREFLALIRRFAISILLRDQTFKAPLHAKQQRAAKEADYLMKLLSL